MSSRRLKYLIAAGVALTGALAAACATMTVHSSVVPGAGPRQFETYKWGEPDTWSTGDPRLDNNRFFDERVRAQVETQLARRGFEKTDTGQPDMLVQYHASVSQEIALGESSNGVDSSIAYCASHDCRPVSFEKGTIVVDLVEPRTKALVWRGWVEHTFDDIVDNQAWMESRIDEAIAMIFTRLPAHF